MVREQLNGHDLSPTTHSAAMSERSPLLRALREGSSSFDEGNYMSMPPPSSVADRLSEAGQFQPIVYAEKALGALLTGVLLYAMCCIAGLLLVSLNFEGVFGVRVNWWLIFVPFWAANGVILVAHIQSTRYAAHLREWADVDSMSNEPLLPLLRRIVLLYAISIPLSLLLLWSELAFCARLEHTSTSLYVCYAPLMVIQVAFVVRYLLCRSDSTVPGVCWILAFTFTLLVAYQTDTKLRAPTVLTYPLSWWFVFAPLLVFQALMAACLALVLFNEFAGIYRLTRWQLGASALYLLALVTGVAGELMLLQHIDYHWVGTFTFPVTLMFAGLASASIAMYIVGRHHVDELMATRGGAVPVPLTRTTDGWVTSHAVVEQWVLFGGIHLTPEGLSARNDRAAISGRRDSAVESSENPGAGLMRRMKQLFRRKPTDHDVLSARDPERRIQNLLQRKTSGTYSDIVVEVINTPKS